MPSFQGSGFIIGLPDGCTDASAYTFLLPTQGSYTPYLTIKAERLTQAVDLESYANKQQASLQDNVDDYKVVHHAAGPYNGMDVVLTTVQWGAAESRVYQKYAYFLAQDEKGYKLFTLTGHDLASQIDNTGPIFDQIFKTFAPNQIQVVEA